MVSPQLREFSHCLSKTHLQGKSTRKSNERIGLEGLKKNVPTGLKALLEKNWI